MIIANAMVYPPRFNSGGPHIKMKENHAGSLSSYLVYRLFFRIPDRVIQQGMLGIGQFQHFPQLFLIHHTSSDCCQAIACTEQVDVLGHDTGIHSGHRRN